MMGDEKHHVTIAKSRREKIEDIERQIMKKAVKSKCSEKKCTLPSVIKPISVVTLKREGVFLPYLRYSKQQERAKLKERLAISISEKYKIAYTELRKRLHIAEPVDDCLSVTDYDTTYFTCVRSFSSNYVAPYKSLKYFFNNQLRWKQELGYRHDSILNIDVNFKREQETYEDTVKSYMQQVKYLDDFISDDYKKSMSFLNNWEKVKQAVDKKALELQNLAAEIFTMTSKILGLDYKYGIQQKYGRFLYYLSPPSWRLKHRNFARSIEIETMGFGFGISSEEDTFNVIFENLKRECASGLVKPVLYFEHPNDLLKIFDGIEQQQLHHFTHVARLAPHACLLKKGIKKIKDVISQDSLCILNMIKNFEKMLQFCEERRLQLERNFFNILYGLFYDSVAAPDVLRLQQHLEFCFEELYNEKPINLDITRTAKSLEDFYMDFSKRLESETSEDIKSAIKQSVESERNKYKRANKAAKELRLFERLEQSLLRAYAPLRVNKDLVIKSDVHLPSPKQASPKITSDDNRKGLTKAEIEYLSLFTDWTDKEDPANFLRDFVKKVDENRLK